MRESAGDAAKLKEIGAVLQEAAAKIGEIAGEVSAGGSSAAASHTCVRRGVRSRYVPRTPVLRLSLDRVSWWPAIDEGGSTVRIKDNRLYFGDHFAGDLAREYGTPLYVYEEDVLRARCRELKNLLKRPNFAVNYSMKANGNVALLEIVRSEGLRVDTMSPGEIFLAMEAGYKPDEILFIGNNVSKAEMSYAIDRGILMSVDSISQLEYFGELKPGGEVVVRINPNIGDGHSAKVITAGRVKFGTPQRPAARAQAGGRQVRR